MLYEKEYTGRCPSERQVLKEIKSGAKLGADNITISWGENGIHVQNYKGQYIGSGWIKNISGQDLAQQL